VSFVTPRDPDYLHVKRVKQGQARVDPVYGAFIEGFRERYGVSPLAVLLDTASRPRGQGRTPRLGVVLERTDEYRAFVRGPFTPERYKQQAVAILFTESLRGENLRAMFGFPPGERHAGVRADEIFVYFDDFERVAKWEVHDVVAAACELADFTASLAIGDRFWCIQRFAGPPIVFVHTDEQARTLKASALRQHGLTRTSRLRSVTMSSAIWPGPRSPSRSIAKRTSKPTTRATGTTTSNSRSRRVCPVSLNLAPVNWERPESGRHFSAGCLTESGP